MTSQELLLLHNPRACCPVDLPCALNADRMLRTVPLQLTLQLLLLSTAVTNGLSDGSAILAHKLEGNDAPLFIKTCYNASECDDWARGIQGGLSVQMPQGCRETPDLESIQAIAVAFNRTTASRGQRKAESDLLLACAENDEGVGQIRKFRQQATSPTDRRPRVLASLNSTDCVLLALTGPSPALRHTQLGALYEELSMCGFDALSTPHRLGASRPIGLLARKPEKEEIIRLIQEEVCVLPLCLGARMHTNCFR